MFRVKEIVFWLILLLIMPSILFAVTMKEAMDKAAEYFVKEAVRIESGQELHVLEVVNYVNKEHDIEGKRIETEIYFALERQFPDFKLFFGKGPTPDKEIYLRGTYDLKGGQITTKFQIFKGNEILAQTEVGFDSITRRKSLVAVLDLEAAILNREQRRVFSEVFRSELNETGAFDLASSADIDKMNPDEIQSATGCTRDTCATIIGEQLGVDRVISSSLSRVDVNFFYLTAKIMDIKDSSILVSKTVEHNGSLKTLKGALKKLARDLSGQPPSIEITREQSSDMPFPVEKIKEDSGWPWWYWAVGVGVLGVVAAVSGGGGEDEENTASSNSNCPAGSGNCGTVGFEW